MIRCMPSASDPAKASTVKDRLEENLGNWRDFTGRKRQMAFTANYFSVRRVGGRMSAGTTGFRRGGGPGLQRVDSWSMGGVTSGGKLSTNSQNGNGRERERGGSNRWWA